MSISPEVIALPLALSYLVGSIPFAYIIVRLVTGEDVTAHGTGNVGAMNVRRSTGSWAWFVAAMVADALKGIVPVAIAKLVWGVPFILPASTVLAGTPATGSEPEMLIQAAYACPAAVAGAVLGHNYSLWMAILKRRFARTGKGLATGGGALLAYDWRYFVAVVVVGLLVIAVTRYMMAGQVAAALTLPATALLLGSPDWPFALGMGLLVYLAHHRRFVGLLKGQEPKLYIEDRMGPRG
jgi:glycerol-3-phosphate acyltransferase PlsY